MGFFKSVTNAVSSVASKVADVTIQKPFEAVVAKPLEIGAQQVSGILGTTQQTLQNNPILGQAAQAYASGGLSGLQGMAGEYVYRKTPDGNSVVSPVQPASYPAIENTDNKKIMMILGGAGAVILLILLLTRNK